MNRSRQSRVPAGVPTGGQFAATNHHEAAGVELSEETPMAELDRIGADHADRYGAIGRLAAWLPASAMETVATLKSRYGEHTDLSGLVGQMSEIAVAEAASRVNLKGDRLTEALRGLPTDVRTDLERAARYYVRRQLKASNPAPAGAGNAAHGDRSWICPVDPSHETLDKRCTVCGATWIPNFDAGSESALRPDDADKPVVDVARAEWTACGNEDEPGGAEAQLAGVVWVGSTPFHALALQVDEEGGLQSSLQRDEDLAAIQHLLGDQTPYETVEIGGRPYVVIMSPLSR